MHEDLRGGPVDENTHSNISCMIIVATAPLSNMALKSTLGGPWRRRTSFALITGGSPSAIKQPNEADPPKSSRTTD